MSSNAHVVRREVRAAGPSVTTAALTPPSTPAGLVDHQRAQTRMEG